MTRPDDVYRTGVIQPYNIMTRTAGQQAQDSISRFIQVARPHGAYVGLDGAGFGLVTPEVIRTLGQADEGNDKYYWAGAGVLLGLLGGVLIGRVL